MIKKLIKNDRDLWWEIARADKHATFFQTPAWLEVGQCMSPKYTDATIMGELDSGVKFVLPITSYSRTWPFKRLYSVYDQSYGGLIANGPVTPAEHHAILHHIPLSPFSSFDLTETPGTIYNNPLRIFETISYSSSQVQINGRSFEELFAKFSKSRRRNYRIARKNGVTLRRANPNYWTDEFNKFYELYLETHDKRWGENAGGDFLTISFLRNLELVAKKYPKNFFMWFAELDGHPISTYTAWAWNGRLDGWFMASKPKFFNIKAAVFVQTEVIRFAADNSFRLFDLGPNVGDETLIEFKRRFGAEEVGYKLWHRPSPILKMIDRLRG